MRNVLATFLLLFNYANAAQVVITSSTFSSTQYFNTWIVDMCDATSCKMRSINVELLGVTPNNFLGSKVNFFADLYGGDGIPELHTFTTTGGKVYEKDADGQYTILSANNPYSIFQDAGVYYQAVTLNDYDNDGDLDMFYTAHGMKNVFIIKNLGTRAEPQFDYENPINIYESPTTIYSMNIQVVDMDKDGAMDVYLTGGNTNMLLMNDGNNTWSKVTDITGGYGLANGAFVDFDVAGKMYLASPARIAPYEKHQTYDVATHTLTNGGISTGATGWDAITTTVSYMDIPDNVYFGISTTPLTLNIPDALERPDPVPGSFGYSIRSTDKWMVTCTSTGLTIYNATNHSIVQSISGTWSSCSVDVVGDSVFVVGSSTGTEGQLYTWDGTTWSQDTSFTAGVYNSRGIVSQSVRFCNETLLTVANVIYGSETTYRTTVFTKSSGSWVPIIIHSDHTSSGFYSPVAFDSTCTRFAHVSRGPPYFTVEIYDENFGVVNSFTSTVATGNSHIYGSSGIEMSPDGQYLAVASDQFGIEIFKYDGTNYQFESVLPSASTYLGNVMYFNNDELIIGGAYYYLGFAQRDVGGSWNYVAIYSTNYRSGTLGFSGSEIFISYANRIYSFTYPFVHPTLDYILDPSLAPTFSPTKFPTNPTSAPTTGSPTVSPTAFSLSGVVATCSADMANCPVTQLGSSTPVFLNSGYSVATSSDGTRVVSGGRDLSGNGKVEVYQYSVSGWSLLGQTIWGPGKSFAIYGTSTYSYFGQSVDMSADGNTIVVGAPYFNNADGRVYVYTYDSGTNNWSVSEIAGVSSSSFGQSVAISDDGLNVVIGAPGYDSPSTNKGKVYTYKYNGNSWVTYGTALGGTTSAYENFGQNVATSGDGKTVGVHSVIGGTVNIFRLSGSTWSKVGSTLISDQTLASNALQMRFSYDGKKVAIRLPGVNANAGYVEVYEEISSVWNLLGQRIDTQAPSIAPGLGFDISSAGDILTISKLELFEQYWYDGNNWVKFAEYTTTDTGKRFGYSLATSDDGLTIAVGVSPYNADGHIEVFYQSNLVVGTGAPSVSPTRSPTSPTAAPTDPSLGTEFGNVLWDFDAVYGTTGISSLASRVGSYVATFVGGATWENDTISLTTNQYLSLDNVGNDAWDFTEGLTLAMYLKTDKIDNLFQMHTTPGAAAWWYNAFKIGSYPDQNEFYMSIYSGSSEQNTFCNAFDSNGQGWDFVAFTIDAGTPGSTSTMRFYMNGTLTKTANIYLPPTVIRSVYYLGKEMNGQLSKMTMYNKALTSTQISQLYNQIRPRYDSSATTLAPTTSTPTTSPTTSVPTRSPTTSFPTTSPTKFPTLSPTVPLSYLPTVAGGTEYVTDGQMVAHGDTLSAGSLLFLGNSANTVSTYRYMRGIGYSKVPAEYNPAKNVFTNSYISLANGDMNGDGVPELYVVGDGVETIQQYVFDSDGILQLDNTNNPFTSVTTSSRTSMVIGDIDGDGLLDAVALRSNYILVFYKNTGTATVPVLTETTTYSTNSGHFTRAQFELVDVDKDGDLDVLIVTNYGRVAIWKNDGGGMFTLIDYNDATNNPWSSVDVGAANSISAGVARVTLEDDTEIIMFADQNTWYKNYYHDGTSWVEYTTPVYSFDKFTVHTATGGNIVNKRIALSAMDNTPMYWFDVPEVKSVTPTDTMVGISSNTNLFGRNETGYMQASDGTWLVVANTVNELAVYSLPDTTTPAYVINTGSTFRNIRSLAVRHNTIVLASGTDPILVWRYSAGQWHQWEHVDAAWTGTSSYYTDHSVDVCGSWIVLTKYNLGAYVIDVETATAQQLTGYSFKTAGFSRDCTKLVASATNGPANIVVYHLDAGSWVEQYDLGGTTYHGGDHSGNSFRSIDNIGYFSSEEITFTDHGDIVMLTRGRVEIPTYLYMWQWNGNSYYSVPRVWNVGYQYIYHCSSLAATGDYISVGCHYYYTVSKGMPQYSQVWLWKYNNGAWDSVLRIANEGYETNQYYFGYSVALSNEDLYVGAYKQDYGIVQSYNLASLPLTNKPTAAPTFSPTVYVEAIINEAEVTFFETEIGKTYRFINDDIARRQLSANFSFTHKQILSNFIVTHNGFIDKCDKIGAYASTNLFGSTQHNVPIVVFEVDPGGTYYTCMLVMDNVFDTDEDLTNGTSIYVYFRPDSNTTYVMHYARFDTPAIVKTGVSVEQYIMRNITLNLISGTDNYILDTSLYRHALTNASCAEPDIIQLTISNDTSGRCTFVSHYHASYVDEESLTFRNTLTRNELLRCMENPPVVTNGGLSLTYEFVVHVDNVLQYTLTSNFDGSTLESWVNNGDSCNSARSFVGTTRNQHSILVSESTDAGTLDKNVNVDKSMFYYKPNSLGMDTSVCDNLYASKVAAMTFEMEIIFPQGSTIDSVGYYGDMNGGTTMTIGNGIVVLVNVPLSCTGNVCTVGFRTLDCLPVLENSPTDCVFELPNLEQNIYLERTYDTTEVQLSGPANTVLPVENFHSVVCPVLTDVIDVSDQYPSSLYIKTGGGLSEEFKIIMQLDEFEDNAAASLEILDVTVSLYGTNNSLWGQYVFSKENKLRGMTIVRTPYYEDAHYCRYNSGAQNDKTCTAFYKEDTLRAHASFLNGSTGLLQMCQDEVDYRDTTLGKTNLRNFDIFAFTPTNWIFNGFNELSGTMNITVSAALRGCSVRDETFADDGRHLSPTGAPTASPTTSRRLLQDSSMTKVIRATSSGVSIKNEKAEKDIFEDEDSSSWLTTSVVIALQFGLVFLVLGIWLIYEFFCKSRYFRIGISPAMV